MHPAPPGVEGARPSEHCRHKAFQGDMSVGWHGPVLRSEGAPTLTFPTIPASTCKARPSHTRARPPLPAWANICYCLVVFAISCLAGKLPSWLSTC